MIGRPLPAQVAIADLPEVRDHGNAAGCERAGAKKLGREAHTRLGRHPSFAVDSTRKSEIR
jgi:hypothetical protein